jgi:hypothetical protein
VGVEIVLARGHHLGGDDHSLGTIARSGEARRNRHTREEEEDEGCEEWT